MDLIAKASGGTNVVGRPQARPAWYPTDTVRPVQVEVYWRWEDEPPAAGRLIGVFAPGASISYPYNPLSDRNIYVGTISIAADGTRSVRDIADANWELLVFQRETDAPTVTQIGESSHTRISLAIDGYSSLAFKRRVRTADDSGMTTNLDVQEDIATSAETLPRVVYLDRSDLGTGTRTIYVRISHSSGGDYGAESAAQAFTWADDTGAGGTEDEGDPFGHKRFDV